MSIKIEIPKKYVVYMPTEKHLIIMISDTRKAVIDVQNLEILRNFGVPQKTLAKLMDALTDKNLSLFKWLKPVTK